MNGRADVHTQQPAAHWGAGMLPLGRVILLLARRLVRRIKQWRHNMVTRRHLAEMPEYLLKDVGLSRQLVQNELQKPFWRE